MLAQSLHHHMNNLKYYAQTNVLSQYSWRSKMSSFGTSNAENCNILSSLQTSCRNTRLFRYNCLIPSTNVVYVNSTTRIGSSVKCTWCGLGWISYTVSRAPCSASETRSLFFSFYCNFFFFWLFLILFDLVFLIFWSTI